LMADLKAHVEDLAVNILKKSNAKVLCEKADMFSCSQLLEAFVQLMVKEGISLDKEEVKKMPDATEAYLGASKVELDKKKGLEKILKKQEREITALRATLRTKSSISTSAKPIPSEREQSVDGRSRGLGGKRSSDERSNNEIETEEEEEEDFSSPPAKVVTPSKRRVVVEYYTSEEEAESSVADQTYSPTIHGGQRGASDDDEQTLLCLECGAIGDVLEEGGDSAEFTCDECLMKVHPECEDPGCAVCRETAAVVEARWIMRSRLETPAQDSGEEEWVTGVEGDSGSQSSDGTDQELDVRDQTGRGGDRNFSTIGGARSGEYESPEGENYKETSGLDSTGDRSIYVIDSTDDDSVEIGQGTDELDSTSERKVADSTGEVSEGGNCSRVSKSMQDVGLPRPHLRHMAQRGPIIMEDSWEERTSSDEEGNDSMSTVF